MWWTCVDCDKCFCPVGAFLDMDAELREVTCTRMARSVVAVRDEQVRITAVFITSPTSAARHLSPIYRCLAMIRHHHAANASMADRSARMGSFSVRGEP